MEKGKDIELRSEAVQEVMGHNLDMLCNIRLYIACYKRNHTSVLTLNRVLKYFRVIYNCYDIKN